MNNASSFGLGSLGQGVFSGQSRAGSSQGNIFSPSSQNQAQAGLSSANYGNNFASNAYDGGYNPSSGLNKGYMSGQPRGMNLADAQSQLLNRGYGGLMMDTGVSNNYNQGGSGGFGNVNPSSGNLWSSNQNYAYNQSHINAKQSQGQQILGGLNASAPGWDMQNSGFGTQKHSGIGMDGGARSLSRAGLSQSGFNAMTPSLAQSPHFDQGWDNQGIGYEVGSGNRFFQSEEDSGPASHAVSPVKVPRASKKSHIYECDGKKVEIRDVWKENLEEEFKIIRKVVLKYNYIAMDTEFPGVVARPTASFNDIDYNYQVLRCNVDLLNLIQLGISFADSEGNLARKSDFMETKDGDEDLLSCCWQFHFKFSLQDDMYAQDSIDLLKRSGLNFDLHEAHGIDLEDFGELLTVSGLVLVPEVHWIAFHGSYDFGYLLKVLTCIPLPEKEEDFSRLLKIYFPHVYDIKHIMKEDFSGGLNRLAEVVEAKRIGQEHQAGSDSLLTLLVFFKMKERHFVDNEDEFMEKSGILHGVGASNIPSGHSAMMSPTLVGLRPTKIASPLDV